MKKKEFPLHLYVERIDLGSESDSVFPASINPADFAEKEGTVELAEYKLVRKVKVRQSVSVEDVK